MQCNNHINIFEILYVYKDKLGFTLLKVFVYFCHTHCVISLKLALS